MGLVLEQLLHQYTTACKWQRTQGLMLKPDDMVLLSAGLYRRHWLLRTAGYGGSLPPAAPLQARGRPGGAQPGSVASGLFPSVWTRAQHECCWHFLQVRSLAGRQRYVYLYTLSTVLCWMVQTSSLAGCAFSTMTLPLGSLMPRILCARLSSRIVQRTPQHAPAVCCGACIVHISLRMAHPLQRSNFDSKP